MSLYNVKTRSLFLILIIIIIDFCSKLLASINLNYGEPVVVLPFFNFMLLHNYGTAFSFLSEPQRFSKIIFFSITAVIISIIIIQLIKSPEKRNNFIRIGLSLILGGAIGNLYDRIIHGHVVDFLDFYIQQYHCPIFNIADISIFLGAGMIIIKNVYIKKNKFIYSA